MEYSTNGKRPVWPEYHECVVGRERHEGRGECYSMISDILDYIRPAGGRVWGSEMELLKSL